LKSLSVLSIFGTRPEAVKMAPVVKALAEQPGIDSRVCVTAQHREMLDQVLDLFQIHPDYDLNLMRPNQTLAGLTAEILENVDPILTKVKPDWILVQGDTTTVMASALAAFYRNIKVGHVEAGMCTGDKHQPFPEEINRRIAGTLADLHFAPTEHSRQNLLREGVEDWRIAVTGNTDIDALQQICKLDEPEQVSRWLTDWGVAAGKARLRSQPFFNAQKLIEFRDAFAAAPGAGLDVSSRRRHGQVRDEGVFGLARTVRHEAAVVVPLG